MTTVPALVNGPTQAYTLAVTVPATTAGNCLVVVVAAGSPGAGGAVAGITLGGAADNFGSLVVTAPFQAGGSNVEIWADPACAGGQTSVAVSGPAATSVQSGSGSVWVYEFSGLAATLAQLPDRSSSAGGVPALGGAWDSGTTWFTSYGAEAWVGGASIAGTVSTVPGAPWANDQPSGGKAVTGWQITTSTGTAGYAGTCTVNANYAAAVVTLYPDPPPPVGPQIYQRSGPVQARYPA